MLERAMEHNGRGFAKKDEDMVMLIAKWISFSCLKIGGYATLYKELYIRLNLPGWYCAYFLVNALSWHILWVWGYFVLVTIFSFSIFRNKYWAMLLRTDILVSSTHLNIWIFAYFFLQHCCLWNVHQLFLQLEPEQSTLLIMELWQGCRCAGL